MTRHFVVIVDVQGDVADRFHRPVLGEDMINVFEYSTAAEAIATGLEGAGYDLGIGGVRLRLLGEV